MLKAAIVGATGYAAAELLRLLSSHPEVQVTHLISDSSAGTPIAEVYPSLHGFCPLVMEKLDAEQLGKECDVVFLALPHGVSAANAPALLAGGCKVIDLSADFRYADLATYEKIYGVTHPCPELLSEAVYGLSEIYPAQISAARLIGNPGCYTTCANLALIPAVRAGLIDPASIIIDAASGTTGAGRKPAQAYHFPETDENYMAYKVAAHRHTSEIEEQVSAAAGKAVRLTFTPHLLPVKRGILSTIYASVTPAFSVEAMYAAYACYQEQPFVYIHPQGTLPQLKMVAGSNMVHIGFVPEPATGRVIILSALDNLVKGAAGQAIQNMNLMFGLAQATGLSTPPWYL
ncbi:MAG: N-acetyl-gamma-glutamyl-phosphate reductase [Eubacteriales bacterium]|nr:N-acetyl-gamma-glutamyl-phosphate reductase [Eubacteriales bacterium]